MKCARSSAVLGSLFASVIACSRTESSARESSVKAESNVRAGAADPGVLTQRAPASSMAAGESTRPMTKRLPASELTWTFESAELGRMVAVVLLPERTKAERFPVLVALHGRGEALKGAERGARGWVDDYLLSKAIQRLHHPPLTEPDFFSFVSKERLSELNAALSQRAYRGMVIVCPYTPDRLAGVQFMVKSQPLARFLVEELLPRVYRETPALGTALATGIDGVSLGGRAAYSIGLSRPEQFGVVAGLQAAFDAEDAPSLVGHARAARQRNPRLSFRMLTSRGDYFRDANTAIARAFSRAELPMKFDVVEGPHDYAFNRGPGAYEMLLFHDRALRGEPPP